MRQEASGYCGVVESESQAEATAWDRSLSPRLARELEGAIKYRPKFKGMISLRDPRLPHYLITKFHREQEAKLHARQDS